MDMRRIVAWLLFSVLPVCLCAKTLAPANSVTTFVIFPPENQSNAQDLSWVGEGLAIAISEEMEMPEVETLSREERVRFEESIDLPPSVPLSRASMIRVAQKAVADRLVFGSYSGTKENLQISVRVLNLKSLKLGGEHVANGPVAALPQLENELAWVLLSETYPDLKLSREEFRARTRTVPNQPFSDFVGCLSVGDDSERAKRVQKTVELYRDFPQASYLLGEYYFGLGDWARSMQYLQPALKGPQNFLETEFMLGTCYLKLEDPSNAVEAYNSLLSRSQSLEAFNNLGVAYLRKGDFPQAARALSQARGFSESNASVILNLAIANRLRGDEAAALAFLEQAVGAHPDQGMIQYLYSLMLDKRGEPEKAARALDVARKLGIDVEKLPRQDPLTWTQIYLTWTRRPVAKLGTVTSFRHPFANLPI
ncbi:MAG: tetratricopeptide repeat protein [Acidobacteriota bacterium]|jgi:tetratricopeptide (TPR) repeat protein